jgi:phosphatidylinositol 3-kinase
LVQVSTRILSDETASLIIELPTFELPIMHEETFYQLPQQGASGSVTPIDLVTYRKSRKPVDEAIDVPIDGPQSFRGLDLITFLDYENEDDNPYEDKYRTLAHDLLRGMVDPDLKPDKEQRSKLEKIIDAPSHHPTREERDLLWRFRFSLVDNRRALTKFLVAVDWSVESEVVQAAELLEQWRRRSPIEVTDALKLLGKHVAFQTNVVRDYAIETLAAAPDSELRLYLLQLVQALKYENSAAVETGTRSSAPSPSNVSPLSSFLINRAAGSMQLANYLYWYDRSIGLHATTYTVIYFFTGT